jgi:hypothetical protein
MCSGRREPRRSGPKPTRLPSQDSGLLGSPGRPGSPRPARRLPREAAGHAPVGVVRRTTMGAHSAPAAVSQQPHFMC